MKYLLLTFSILFLASCQQYKYEVTYEKCNGHTGSLISKFEPHNNSYLGEEPVEKPLYYSDGMESNICDFSYTKTPISDNQ